jgi:hypothetical protein
MSKKLIEPIYRRCKCGNRIIHHHILCDKCWKRKQRMKINKLQVIKEENTLLEV